MISLLQMTLYKESLLKDILPLIIERLLSLDAEIKVNKNEVIDFNNEKIHGQENNEMEDKLD